MSTKNKYLRYYIEFSFNYQNQTQLEVFAELIEKARLHAGYTEIHSANDEFPGTIELVYVAQYDHAAMRFMRFVVDRLPDEALQAIEVRVRDPRTMDEFLQNQKGIKFDKLVERVKLMNFLRWCLEDYYLDFHKWPTKPQFDAYYHAAQIYENGDKLS